MFKHQIMSGFQLADFVNNLDRVNAFAEQPGDCVRRLRTQDGDATVLQPSGDKILINLSVCENIEYLEQFVDQTAPVEFVKRCRAWFEKVQQSYIVLCSLPAGHEPGGHAAGEELKSLQSGGPSEEAFTFKEHYPTPETHDDR